MKKDQVFEALKNLSEVLKNPEYAVKEELPAQCKACEGGIPALPKDKIEKIVGEDNLITRRHPAHWGSGRGIEESFSSSNK